MKNLKAIVILTLFLAAISVSGVLAQGRQTKTSGAKAAYGYPTEVRSKKKKKKQSKPPKKKAKSPINRQRNPWVN